MQAGRVDCIPFSNRVTVMHLADIPTRNNPIGAKGAGELGCVGAPAAFMNAAADTADPRAADMPATPERPWRAVRAK